jgi:hypothetical protein
MILAVVVPEDRAYFSEVRASEEWIPACTGTAS